MAHAVAAPLIGALVWLLWRSCRIQCVLGERHLDSLVEQPHPFIPCYWHSRQLFCIRYLLGLRHRGVKLGFLVSPSADGELAARIARRWGGHVIRGSSTRTGAQAMRELYQAIARDGISPVTTPDGPRGPAHELKWGTVMLAQLSGAPMLAISYAARRAWRLKTWDRFVLPRPFTRVAIAIGEPRYVDRRLSAAALEPIRQEMQDTLNRLDREAEAALAPAS